MRRTARTAMAAVAAVAVSLSAAYVVGSLDAAEAAEQPLPQVGQTVEWGGEPWSTWGPLAITQVAAGENFLLALKPDGTVQGRGFSNYGQASVPYNLTGVTQIAAGQLHSLALKSDGTVVAWGWNGFGQTQVPAGLTGVTQVDGGSTHSLALKSDGTVVAWGGNGQGQANVPAGLTDVVQVSAGANHSLALKSDGTVVAWGGNSFGQLDVPADLTDVASVSAGNFHNLAVKHDGTVVAWGNDDSGESTVPSGLNGVTQVVGGSAYSLALRQDGTVVGWGWNGQGHTDVPAGLTDVIQVEAGVKSIALVADTDPPETTISSGPGGPTAEPNPVFHFSADEDGATFECRMDTEPFAACESPYTSPALSNGRHTFEVRATDLAGNVDPTPGARELIVEPTVAFADSSPAVAENIGIVDLTVTRGGNTTVPATVEYALEAGTATPGTDVTLSADLVTFAAGETTTTLPVTVANDTETEPDETLSLALRDPHTGRRLASTDLTVTASDQQPDALVSTKARRGYVGDDIYNTTAASQTRKQTTRRTQTREFYVRVANDGNAPNTLTVKGSASRADSTVRYYAGSTSITSAMRSGSGWAVTLEPGATRRIKVTIRVRRSAALGSIKVAKVTTRWVGDDVLADAAKAVVKVTR